MSSQRNVTNVMEQGSKLASKLVSRLVSKHVGSVPYRAWYWSTHLLTALPTHLLLLCSLKGIRDLSATSYLLWSYLLWLYTYEGIGDWSATSYLLWSYLLWLYTY